jgi:hypothetical protein
MVESSRVHMYLFLSLLASTSNCKQKTPPYCSYSHYVVPIDVAVLDPSTQCQVSILNPVTSGERLR